MMNSVESGLKITGSAIAVNIILALIKITTLIIGNSYALIADGIESTMDIEEQIRNLASQVAGVIEIEKCRIRKSGISLLMEIHVVAQEDISVREGLDIGHGVKILLLNSDLKITGVSVQIEPNIDNPSISIA